MLRKPWASNYIVELNSASGERVVGTDGAMQVFTDLFAELYAEPPGLDVEAAQGYFSEISLLSLDDSHRSYLDVPFSVVFYSPTDIFQVLFFAFVIVNVPIRLSVSGTGHVLQDRGVMWSM
ncbi:hypothetical protein NDU88_003876 [Pleurodeles waltl]|uniref:Uncharacterized protein n=1 Tax=Pleurodeles waltl TaxID=8319 RepID=A0AAV7T746_PLEWA|nr:hypothetical protein NDU88_003876 [Pleurodeles waltl]